jgi:UDP-N-acetylglucosamine acyltransferase
MIQNISPKASVHPTAIINATAIICSNVTIEEGVTIGAYCIIGSPAEYKGREDKMMGVHIGKGTRITGMVTIDSGTMEKTYVGENCYIMKHAHIGHDARVENNVTISCGAKIGGHCVVEDNANIGLNAVLHQYVVVPKDCMIGASAFVGLKSQLDAGYKYAGVPVKCLGLNIKKAKPNLSPDEIELIKAIEKASIKDAWTNEQSEAFIQGAYFFKHLMEQNKVL